MGLENMARSRKQDIIFAILKPMPKRWKLSMGMALKFEPDGFGFDRRKALI